MAFSAKYLGVALAMLLPLAVFGGTDHTLATVSPACKEMYQKMVATHYKDVACHPTMEKILSAATTDPAVCVDTKVGSAVSKCIAISEVRNLASKFYTPDIELHCHFRHVVWCRVSSRGAGCTWNRSVCLPTLHYSGCHQGLGGICQQVRASQHRHRKQLVAGANCAKFHLVSIVHNLNSRCVHLALRACCSHCFAFFAA
jgi:hypothetical protein